MSTLFAFADFASVLRAARTETEPGSPASGSTEVIEATVEISDCAPARKERGKYKKDRDAPRKGAFLCSAEALQAAAAEGLELQRSDNSTSGFRGVLYRPNIKSKPYLVKHWVGTSYKLLGAFPTGEEAALTFARAKRDITYPSAGSSSSYTMGADGQPMSAEEETQAPKRARKLTRPLHSWSTEDDQRLLSLCQGFNDKRTTSLKEDWEPVAEKMGAFCSASAMKLRWRMLAGKRVGAINSVIGQRAAGIADGSIPPPPEGRRKAAGSSSEWPPDALLALYTGEEEGAGRLRGSAGGSSVAEMRRPPTVDAVVDAIVDIVTEPRAFPGAERAAALHCSEHLPEAEPELLAGLCSIERLPEPRYAVPELESAHHYLTVTEVPPEVPMEVPPAVEDEESFDDDHGASEEEDAVEEEEAAAAVRAAMGISGEEEAELTWRQHLPMEVPPAMLSSASFTGTDEEDSEEEGAYGMELVMVVPPAVPADDGYGSSAEERDAAVSPTMEDTSPGSEALGEEDAGEEEGEAMDCRFGSREAMDLVFGCRLGEMVDYAFGVEDEIQRAVDYILPDGLMS